MVVIIMIMLVFMIAILTMDVLFGMLMIVIAVLTMDVSFSVLLVLYFLSHYLTYFN